MIVDMAKVLLPELEAAKLNSEGDSIAANTQAEFARRIVVDAQAALPKGVPGASPYAKLPKEGMLHEASRLDIVVGPLLSDEELRVVIEHARMKLMNAGAPKPSPPAPPVPMQPVVPVKIRGLKPSPTNAWIVKHSGERPKQVSVGNGQMAAMRNGARIELRHYSPQILQGMVDQGLDLIPVEDDQD